MEFNLTNSDSETIAQIQLFKAHVQKKTSLMQEINQLKISSSYYHSNSTFRDFRDMSNLNKSLQKRVGNLRLITTSIKSFKLKAVSTETLSNLLESIKSIEPQLEISRQIFSLNFQVESYVEVLKDHHESLLSSFQQKTEELQKNEEVLKGTLSQRSLLESLEREINDYSQELSLLHKENKELEIRKETMLLNKKSNVGKIKLYHNLSDCGVKLISMKLLKQELLDNLKEAEFELKDLTLKVENNKIKLKNAEIENEKYKKNQVKFEVELKELEEKAEKLRKKIIELKRDKEGSALQEERELADFSSIISGFDSMKKERISLAEENNKLKARISRLYSSRSRINN